MMEFSKRTLRRMDMLKNICDFDTQNGIATVFVRFRTVGEMLDSAAGNTKEPVLSKNTVHLLKSMVDVVPNEFDIDVSVTVDDYGDYNAESLARSYRAAIEKLNYKKRCTQKRKNVIIATFVGIGLLFLVLLLASEKLHIFSPVGPALAGVITLFIELIFEVFFEEGALMFVMEKCFGRFFHSNAKRFRNVTFHDTPAS